jgi:nucleoside-diphosphate-sugar epimerase
MVGSALLRRLARERCEVLTVERSQLDLRRQQQVEDWLIANRPEAVINAAATVGGIQANAARPSEFLYDNLAITSNIVHGAAKAKVAKLLFLGAGCVYPRLAPQPMREDSLLTGPPEPTNEWYTVAKIAGIKLCQAYRRQYGNDFISAVPANLYGPGDRFDEASGHVVAGLIARTHEPAVAGVDLGDRPGAARIHARRRLRRRPGLAADEVLGRATHQCRHRTRGVDRGPCAEGRLGRRILGSPRIRFNQTGRNAAQAARFLAHACHRMARRHEPR